MNIEKNSKRKAISPILATVILIAITLVAAVAIAGFVFGLFGSLGSSANLTVSVATCSASDFAANQTPIPTGFIKAAVAAPTCAMTVTDSGTAAGTVSACSIGGAPGILYVGATGVAAPATGIKVSGSTSVGMECGQAGTPTIGAAVSGTLTTGNVADSFAGTWGS